jgi:molybdopterin molybdotransferase
MDLDAARQLLLGLVCPCAAERVTLEYGWGRLLAEDVVADVDFPPFDRSPLDGYAVHSRDVECASVQKPVILEQIDYIPAGHVGRHTIGSGQTARIMTGASLPPGADGVVRQEDTVQNGTHIHILAGTNIHQNICRQGEELRKGEIVLRQGMLMGAGAMGVLAMLGKHAPLVYQRPRVGVLATGSEIIEVSQQLVPGKIRNSNTYMLLAQIKDAGGEPVLLGKVEDVTDKIVETLQKIPQCDIVITTGGASVGDYDLMGQVFLELGVPVLFNRLAIKPGMPVVAGRWQDKLLLALSGNPAAASVAFEVLVRPLIKKMAGDPCLWRPLVKAVLKDSFHKKPGSRRFVWAQCHWQEQGWEVLPLFYQSNGMLKSMVFANALIDVPPGSLSLSVGETVNVMLLGQPSHNSTLMDGGCS